MDAIKEKELVKRAQSNPDAFSELFDLYYPKILNFAVRRLGNVETAKDITSQVFVKVLNNIKKFEWRNIPFSSWIYRIATNEINDHFRRGKRSSVQSLDVMMTKYGFEPEDMVDIEEELIEAEAEVEKHRLFLHVQKELLQLELAYQEVLALKFFEHKSTSEIAEILNKKEGTVKSLVFRGIAKLRERLMLSMQPIQPSGVLKVDGK